MFSLDPRPDLFKIAIPDEFFDDEIIVKYNMMLKQKNYVFDDFKDVINESVQSFDIPAFGYTAVTQEQKATAYANIEHAYVPAQSEQKMTDNQFSISLRHSEGYLTYWCMLEHLLKKYQLGPDGNRTPLSSLPLQALDYKQRTIAELHFEKVLFTGLDAISFGYNQLRPQFSTFTMSFAYSTFKTKFTIPELKLNP